MLNPELIQRASELDKSKTPYAIVTVVRAISPTAGIPGDKAIVTEGGEIIGWIGGGCAQTAVIKAARATIKRAAPTLIRVTSGKEVLIENGIVSFQSSCPSGGTLDIFIEPVKTNPTLWVLGSSPVAEKLVCLAAAADFDVKVAAPLGKQAQFAAATEFFDDFEYVKKPATTPSYIIVATQGKRDKAALEASLAVQSRFLGFVASARKAMTYKQALIDKGFDEQKVNAIASPVGLNVNAKTPADIALSILVQVVMLKNKQSLETDFPRVVEKQVNKNVTKTAGGCCGG